MLYLPELSIYSTWVFGVVGLVVGLGGLLVSAQRSPGQAGVGWAAALVALVSLGAISAATGNPPGLGWPLLVLAALVLMLQVARSDWLARVLTAVFARARTPRWQWATLAVGCPALAVWLAHVACPQYLETPPVRNMPPSTVVTDRGRDVPVAQVTAAWPPDEARLSRESGLDRRVIQVAPADWSCNCHGWVFTGGRYLLADWNVELILQDNDYRAVEKPQGGDLVVYRDARGAVWHSAVVWAIGRDGDVLVESKWAWGGRYLHPPDATPYGQEWTYYRSSRPGHQLRCQERPPRRQSSTAPLFSVGSQPR
jgi:hypothetical protein